MIDTLLAVGSIYVFIALGFVAKKHFQHKIDQRGLMLLTVYYIQPFLTFWGLNTQQFDFALLKTPLIFIFVSLFVLTLSFLLSRIFFQESKSRSIATVSGVIGNTGNLGIPLGVALFGESSVMYTSLINLANVFIVYTLGVYFYSRGAYSVKDSLVNIAKLPAIWVALLAMFYSYEGFVIGENFMRVLTMGAYSAMVLQLVIFGMYLYSVKIKEIEKRLMLFINGVKFVLIPLFGMILLQFFELSPIEYSVILLELIVPLAVMNVNLSALYECKAEQVTAAVFITSLVFLLYLPFFMSFVS